MSDAEMIREYVEASGYEVVDAPDGHPVITPRAIAPILAALDRLVAAAAVRCSNCAAVEAERDEARREAMEAQQLLGAFRPTLEAAEKRGDYRLLLAFDREGDDDKPFTLGFECGRVWEMAKVNEDEFTQTVHAENAEMMLRIGEALVRPVSSEEISYGYLDVTFGEQT
jgi:hypothetical protein